MSCVEASITANFGAFSRLSHSEILTTLRGTENYSPGDNWESLKPRASLLWRPAVVNVRPQLYKGILEPLEHT
ncbi:hypothetical protein ABVK25_007309 [Lepraria finkii]|uniref:Uncharacterized protein n=1 Tax=Lepraria finkii TaxID=1340010 RepID=A0ABR4B3G5_9LECA